MRRGRGDAVRVLRAPRDRRRPVRQADHRHRPRRDPRAERARAPGARQRGARDLAGSAPPRSARSSRTRSAWGRCTPRTPGSSTSPRWPRQLAADSQEAGGELSSAGRSPTCTPTARDPPRRSRRRRRSRPTARCSAPGCGQTGWRSGPAPTPTRGSSRSAALPAAEGRPAQPGQGLIYPVPDPELPFLGVHLTPQIGGEVVLGPSALLVGARDAYGLQTRPRPGPPRHAVLARQLADGPQVVEDRAAGDPARRQPQHVRRPRRPLRARAPRRGHDRRVRRRPRPGRRPRRRAWSTTS